MRPLQKIMYIEDEPDITAIAQIALVDIGGFVVKCCSNGHEALALVKEFDPDLFLIDVMMPGMDGPTTLSELRKHQEYSKTPIIFMTAKTQQSEIKEYLAMGVVSVITKPFDPLQLATTLREVWEKTQLASEGDLNG